MSADANVFRWAIRRFFSKTELDAGALDARYFAESEFINTSAGAGDAGKPIKLDAGGKLDASFIDSADFSGYALLAGRSGGQTLIGGTASGNNLTLQSTSNATKGKILASGAAYDEVNTRLGIGTTSPTVTFHISGSDANAVRTLLANAQSGSDLSFYAAGTTGYGISGWADASIIESGTGASGGLVLSAYAGPLLIQTGAQSTRVTVSAAGDVSMTGALAVTGNITQNSVAVVTTSGTQTLTNKTLTTPIISQISNTGTLTLPTSTDTLVGRATTDTLTNKTLTTPTISSTGFTNAQHAHTGASSGGQLDHGAAMTGLGDDDHTQYALLAGRSGGSTLYGGTAANDDLTLHGTSNATRTSSYVIVQPSGGQMVVGASAPLTAWLFEAVQNGMSIALNPGYLSTTNYISSYNSGGTVPLAFFGSRVFVDGNQFGIGTSKTPTGTADSSGTTGDFGWDASYLYIKTAGGWRRVATSTF